MWKGIAMGSEIALFKDMPALDASVVAFFDEESNIKPKTTVPSMGYEGKVWSISINGEKTKLMKKNEDGDNMPLGIMRVVVLGYNQRRGRAYYEAPTIRPSRACRCATRTTASRSRRASSSRWRTAATNPSPAGSASARAARCR